MSIAQRSPTLATIFAVSLAVTTVTVFWLGIRTGADTAAYVAGADLLVHQHRVSGRVLSFVGFEFILAVLKITFGRIEPLIVLNVVAGGVAACAAYALGQMLFGRTGGLLAAALIIINVDIGRWASYLLTDSLYISIVTVAAWTLAARPRPIYGLAAVIVAALIRPNGWLLLPIAFGYSAITAEKPMRFAVAGALSFGVGRIRIDQNYGPRLSAIEPGRGSRPMVSARNRHLGQRGLAVAHASGSARDRLVRRVSVWHTTSDRIDDLGNCANWRSAPTYSSFLLCCT